MTTKLTTNNKQIIASKIIYEDGERHILIIEAGFRDFSPRAQLPYFAITAQLWRANEAGERIGKDCVRCGRMHDNMAKYYPEYDNLIKFHLLDSAAGLSEYVANIIYHLEKGNIDAFKSICCFDEDSEVVPNLEGVENWLKARIPALKARFYSALESHGFDTSTLRTELIK